MVYHILPGKASPYHNFNLIFIIAAQLQCKSSCIVYFCYKRITSIHFSVSWFFPMLESVIIAIILLSNNTCFQAHTNSRKSVYWLDTSGLFVSQLFNYCVDKRCNGVESAQGTAKHKGNYTGKKTTHVM